jgi:hypothetical protein
VFCGVNNQLEQCAKFIAKGVASLNNFISACPNKKIPLVTVGQFVHESFRKLVLKNKRETVCQGMQDEIFCEQLHLVRHNILPKQFSFKDTCFSASQE